MENFHLIAMIKQYFYVKSFLYISNIPQQYTLLTIYVLLRIIYFFESLEYNKIFKLLLKLLKKKNLID
jgi:hypothetical protein